MSRTIKIPETLFRSAQFEREAINEAERTVELSISSEAPYKRFFGTEILDHQPASVRLERMANGAPLLFNHDRNAHIGRIIESRLENGKLRVKAKFGNSALANEKWQDVKDGILKETSVGYQVAKMVLEEEKEGECTYRVTEWTPYEGSLVTIPADSSVGVGRMENLRELEISIKNEKLLDVVSQICEKPQTKQPSMQPETTTPTTPSIEVIRDEAVASERKRVNEIRDLSKHFADNGLAGRKIDTSALAGEFVASGKTARDFQDAVVRGNFPEVKPVSSEMPDLGMSKKETKAFSFSRAILNIGTGRGLQGLEREASDAHAKILGKDCGPNCFYVPMDVHRAAAFNGSPEQIRALLTNVYSGAGALVGTDLLSGSLIELLRNQMLTVKLGARSLSGLRGNVAIPRQTGGATASWLAEDSTITATQQTVGQLNLTPHKLAAATAFSEQLVMQSSVDVENMVRNDLMAVTSIARDLAAIAGTGVSGQPIGILNLGTTNLSTPVTLSAAQSMTYANAVKFELNVSLNNALAGKLGYLTTPTVKNNAKLIAEIASTNSIPVWKDDRVNGYPALATNQMPTATSVIFGNWDDLILADWAESHFFVDPYSLSLQGQIRVINRLYCDNGVRHGTSFSVATN